MATTYELKTLNDVFEKVPTDKLRLCMQEIADSIAYNRYLSESMGIDVKTLCIDTFQWIDDGKEDKAINMNDVQTGESVFTFKTANDDTGR